MKKILVATDFTEYADYAVSSAASLARKTGAQLILLHVINRPLNAEDDSYENYHNMPGSNTVVSSIKSRLEEIVNKHHITDAKVIHVLRYDVFQTILKHADNQQVDLIVMGAYGSTGEEGSFIGSNTERVMQHAKMPVLIVKEKIENFNIENMVLASEFYGEIYKVFPKMKMIIDLFDTKLHLLKVNTPGQFQRTHDSVKLMEKFSREFGLVNYTTNIYSDLNIEDGIVNFSKSIHADLIAITPDGLWRWAHIFNKNTTEQLMKNTIKVILSMKSLQPTPTLTEDFYEDAYKRYTVKG